MKALRITIHREEKQKEDEKMSIPKKEEPFCEDTEKEFCDDGCVCCPFNDCGCCFAYRLKHEFDGDGFDPDDP